MFSLTRDGWLYPSLPESPSNYSVYHAMDLRKWGRSLWMKIGSGGLHVGMTADVIRIDGTGDESPDRAQIDLYPSPLSIANPPVDESVYGDGHTIIYRAADGLMTLAGPTSVAVSQDGMLLPWRGISRHGIDGLNTMTGRFRIAVDNHRLYMLAPEGDITSGTRVIYRYNGGADWDRFTYPVSLWSLDRGADGRLIAGDGTGQVWELETDATTDNGAPIPIVLRSPIEDGGSPLQGKTPLDLQVGTETGGQPLLVTFHVNGTDSPTSSLSTIASGGATYRASALGIGDFNRIQYRMSGSFTQFILRHLNLSYRSHPQQTMVVDTGYLTTPNNAQVGWISKVEVCAKSDYDLELVPIFDDVERTAIPLPVVPGKASIYTTGLRRGQDHGRRPMIRIRTTAADGAGERGAEIYWIRVHFSGTGNRTERQIVVNFGSISGEGIS